MQNYYKVLVTLLLSFCLPNIVFSQLSDRDAIGSRAILYMPGVTIQQINKIKTTFSSIPEISEATFIGGQHQVLIVNLEPIQGQGVVYYSDLIKRLSTCYNAKDILIKEPIAFDEIMKTTGADIINFIK